MANCTLPDLFQVDPCLYAQGPRTLQVLRIQILCSLLQWLQDGSTTDCNLTELLNSGACGVEGAVPFNLDAVELTLFCSMTNALFDAASGAACGGPFGTIPIWGSGSPEGVKVGCKGKVYTDIDTGDFYKFIGVDGTTIGWV